MSVGLYAAGLLIIVGFTSIGFAVFQIVKEAFWGEED